MPNTCEVYGNYGTMIVDRLSGIVLEYRPDIDATEKDGYYDIIRVEPSHMHPTGNCDILCCAFWTDKGELIPRAVDPEEV